MGYEGHLLLIEDQGEKAARICAALGQLVETKERLERAGMACPIVSCGGTGSLTLRRRSSRASPRCRPAG